MLLLVGLGNPNPNNSNNRHNVGFLIIDAINEKFKLSKQKPKFKGLLTTGKIDEQKVFAIKPLTFMNNSGICIKELIEYFKIDVKNVFVFHDDTIDSGEEKITTSSLEFAKIFEAGMELGIRIPTFEEVVLELDGRDEPVMVEIKQIFSDAARREVIDALSSKENWKAMATPERFEKNFPQETRKMWSEAFGEAGVELVRVGRHRVNLFGASESSIGWFYARPKWFFGI